MGRCCGPAAAKSPSPVPLTLIVSLEAIFLSTFVMIGQNRQAAFQQDKAEVIPSGSVSANHTGPATRPSSRSAGRSTR